MLMKVRENGSIGVNIVAIFIFSYIFYIIFLAIYLHFSLCWQIK